MPIIWNELLSKWNEDVFRSGLQGARISPALLEKRWLGQSGASDAEILMLEDRLGTRLPNSYKQFLRYTNGWHLVVGSSYQIWGTEQVQWLRVRHQQDWIEPWSNQLDQVPDEQYFVYGREQDTANFRGEYLATALEISEVFDGGVFLLNPEVVTSDGEWEAWFMATWLAGAKRYPSFWELMNAEYEVFRSLGR